MSWRDPITGLPANEKFLDRYSLAHVTAGALFRLYGISAPLAIGSQIAFELVENDLKRWQARFFPEADPDAWQNHVGDVATFALGYYGVDLVKDDPRLRWIVLGIAGVSAAIWMNGLLPKQRVRGQNL